MDTQSTDNFDDAKKEMQTRFALLPEDIQNVITSSDYQMRLFDIAKKYKLTYEQLGSVEFETTMVLLGTSNPNSYADTVASELKKKPEDVAEMINEIKNQVFDPIHASLVNLYQGQDGDADDQETPVSEETITSTEKDVLGKSGISLEKDGPATTPTANNTGNRADMLKDLENPPKSTATVLNEIPKITPAVVSTMPITKPIGVVIPVPRAPYAGGAPTANAVKETIPLTAKPATDIMAGKLGGTFAMPKSTTDLSVKNIGATVPPAKTSTGSDSYREPIE